MLDFEKIKDGNPIEQVAERLGLELKKSNNQLRGPCPSGEGGERALVITPSKGVWYSFALEKGGDVIALVQLVNDCSAKDAAAWIEPLEKTDKSPPKSKGERGFKPLDYLQHDHAAVEALGLDPEDAEALGMGYAPRGVMRGKVAIPIRTETGQLAGYLGITECVLPPKWNL